MKTRGLTERGTMSRISFASSQIIEESSASVLLSRGASLSLSYVSN